MRSAVVSLYTDGVYGESVVSGDKISENPFKCGFSRLADPVQAVDAIELKSSNDVEESC